MTDLGLDSSHKFTPLMPGSRSSSILGADPSLPASHPSSSSDIPSPLIWKKILSSQYPKSQTFSLSFVTPDEGEVVFSEEAICEGQKDWELSLVGYALGKRPFYFSLLAAVKKKWDFKGTFELLALEGDFFLFKFSCQEDFDMVWDSGTCFLNGRPFFFKKWSWNFSPVKEDIKEIPVWIKLLNLPLCCWNELGISKIASWIGIPLAVDNLTASKSRITFARVCVLISPTSTLPSSIPIDLDGMEFDLKVAYDWKPDVCKECNTFTHDISSCPLHNKPQSIPRWRSVSRPRRGRSNIGLQQPSRPKPQTNLTPSTTQTPANSPAQPISNSTPPTDSKVEEPLLATSPSSSSDHVQVVRNNPLKTRTIITRSSVLTPSRISQGSLDSPHKITTVSHRGRKKRKQAAA